MSVQDSNESATKCSQLVPPDPPRAVQSTAILSASPVSTVKLASTNTLRDFLSRMSTVGSNALKGNEDCRLSDDVDDAACANTVDGCKMSKRGVAL